MQIAVRDTPPDAFSSCPVFIFLDNDLLSPLSMTDLSGTASYMVTHADLSPAIPGLTTITVTNPRDLSARLESATGIKGSGLVNTVCLIIDIAALEAVHLGEHCHNVLDVMGATINTTLLLPFRFEREVEFGKSMEVLSTLTKRRKPPTFIAYPAPALVTRGQERYFRQCRDALPVEHLDTLITLMTLEKSGDEPPTP